MMKFVVTGTPATIAKNLKDVDEANPQYYMYNGFALSGFNTSQSTSDDKVYTFEFSKEQEEYFYEWLKGRHEYRATHEEPKYEREESFSLYTRF